MANVTAKPVYGRILQSRAFNTRAEAEEFAQDMKKEYKGADVSLKFDITRTQDSRWKATIYQKL